MTATIPDNLDRSRQRQTALARWDYEGGAGPDGPQEGSDGGNGKADVQPLAKTELTQLRVRVIALENLMIALLAEATDRQLSLARDMAAYISPRLGATRHPVTVHAASQMINLVERADHFKSTRSTTLNNRS